MNLILCTSAVNIIGVIETDGFDCNNVTVGISQEIKRALDVSALLDSKYSSWPPGWPRGA